MYPLSRSSDNFRKALEIANDITVEKGATYVGSEHFIYAFLCLPNCRAYGLLTNCAMLSQNELTDGMVKLKLGMALGFFKARDIHAFNDFLADMRPASFRLENNLRGATERECSIARAEIVGQVLPELMLRID